MTSKNGFIERYESGNTPWDLGRPDKNIIEVVTKTPVPQCKALDVGCGTGDNAVWLAQQGFTVTGCDVSEIAIKRAGEKAADAGVECSFFVCEFLDSTVPGAPFELVFDRGCFHSFDSEKERKRFAKNVYSHLGKNGLWLTLAGSADDPPRDTGPPRRTAKDLVAAVEKYFEIISLKSGFFDSKRKNPARAWIFLMRKRG